MEPTIAAPGCKGMGFHRPCRFAQAAGMVALPPAPAPVVIADYGSSQGRNSLHPMAVAIGVLRGRLGPERAISVVHIDLPESDFTALFQTLQNEPESYL